MKKYIILKKEEGSAPRETFAKMCSEETLERETKKLVEHSSISYAVYEVEKIGVIDGFKKERGFHLFES